MSAEIFQKSRLGAIKVERSKFYTEDPQIWRATMQNWAAMEAWRPGFGQTCYTF